MSPASEALQMPAVTAPTRTGLADRAAHADRLLRSGAAAPEQVHAALSALDGDELIHFGYNAYLMSFLALFGQSASRVSLEALARAATRCKLWLGWEYFHHYLPRVGTDYPASPMLQDLPLARVRSLLRLGRGLVIVTFHQGHFRYVASDLALSGIPLAMPLAEDASVDFAAARRSLPASVRCARPRSINVETLRGALELAQTLRAGGCLCTTIDGNIGLDGQHDTSHRLDVDILGCPARVKSGMLQLAARHGAPVLAIYAHTVNGRKQAICGDVMDPLRPLGGDEADSFARDATTRVYAQFARHIIDYPDEWNGGDHFQLWRARPATGERSDTALADGMARVQAALDQGERLQVDVRRVVAVDGDDNAVWTDVADLRCYRLPPSAEALAVQLWPTAGGVDGDWLAQRNEEQQTASLTLLAQLLMRGLICRR